MSEKISPVAKAEILIVSLLLKFLMPSLMLK